MASSPKETENDTTTKETENETATPEAIRAALEGRLKDFEASMRDRNLTPRARREAQLSVQALRRVLKMF
jgi:hypothetical protein